MPESTPRVSVPVSLMEEFNQGKEIEVYAPVKQGLKVGDSVACKSAQYKGSAIIQACKEERYKAMKLYVIKKVVALADRPRGVNR